MGSSHYANLVAAARLRAAGVAAVAELASTDLLPAVTPGTLVVAVSASAGSAETLDAVDRLGAPFVAVANREGAADRAGRADRLGAGGRGARRGRLPLLPAHAGAALALESRLTGGAPPPLTAAAEASADLLRHRATGGGRASPSCCSDRDGTHVVAPRAASPRRTSRR